MGLSLGLQLLTALFLMVLVDQLCEIGTLFKLTESGGFFLLSEAIGTIGRWVTHFCPCSCLYSCEHSQGYSCFGVVCWNWLGGAWVGSQAGSGKSGTLMQRDLKGQGSRVGAVGVTKVLIQD